MCGATRYARCMKTVSIDELQKHLSGCLQLVKSGEEVIVRDESVPVARILPFRQRPEWSHEADLLAAGALKVPEEVVDWDSFFFTPAGSVTLVRSQSTRLLRVAGRGEVRVLG